MKKYSRIWVCNQCNDIHPCRLSFPEEMEKPLDCPYKSNGAEPDPKWEASDE